MRTPRRLIGTFIAVGALLAVIPASASALGLTGLSAGPTDPQAGGHNDFVIQMGFDGTGGGTQVKNLSIGLPPGEVGDPTATPKCSVAQLNAASCPANTKVGEVSAVANLLGIPLPVPASGFLYNLDVQPGEPARFGIVLSAFGSGLAPIILQSAVQLRTTDYGLTTIINNIPNTTLIDGDTTIVSQTITLYGNGHGLSKPFARSPTSCGSHTTTFSAVPWTGAPASGSANFTTNGCANEDFSPSLTAELTGAPALGPTTAISSIDQDNDEAGLITAKVAVPRDLAPNFPVLNNVCSDADFHAGACPPNTVVGSAIALSPLLTQPLIGPVELVQGSSLPDIGLDLAGQLHLQLKGSLALDQVVTFDNLPDIPISHFQLTFANPPSLLLANRNLCTPPPPLFHADFTGYNGATVPVDSQATVIGSCAGGNAGAKCKKAKKHKKKHRAAESKKKHKKKSCKKKKRKKHRK